MREGLGKAWAELKFKLSKKRKLKPKMDGRV